MKLATYVAGETEDFGIVLTHPAAGQEWVFHPEQVEALHKRYAVANGQQRFLASHPWPRDIVSFLALGEEGMSAAHQMQDFVLQLLEQQDPVSLAGVGRPVDEVNLQAPVPRPRFYFGLVQNSARLLRRSRPMIWNLYPQGHARPQGSVLGPGDPVYVGSDAPHTGWNPEPGVIIGRGGKHIAVEHAMEHVAGLTVVLDMHNGDYQRLYRSSGLDPKADWFVDATTSWLGKLSDTMGPMGPYLTTMDEVGDPYDLLIYTRQFGQLIGRSHTNAMLISIEHLVSWLSSFMTLYPGDVLHMATMGQDGIPIDLERPTGPEDLWEGEIERVGVLRVPVVKASLGDWRAPDDPSRTIHPSPAVRHAIERGNDVIQEPETWSLEQTRHFWTLYGNYEAAPETEGLDHCPLPRLVHGPASALSASGQPIEVAPQASTLFVGPELAFVVGKLAYQVTKENAAEHILGYVALASILDDSFRASIREPATPQARSMPKVYGRWGDGYNAISLPPAPLAPEAVKGRTMCLSVDGIGEVTGSTDEYLLLAPWVLSVISRQITLFPGDVVTLGRMSHLLTVPADRHLPSDTTLRATIEGIGQVLSPLIDHRESCEEKGI